MKTGFKGIIFLAVVWVLFCGNAYAQEYYVAPDGSDLGPGSLEEPFQSIMKAQEAASAGDTVYLRDGVYDTFEIAATDANYNYVHDMTKSGITYQAYPGERPVFDFQKVPVNLRVCAFHVRSGVQNVAFEGFDVTGVKVGEQKQSECFRIEGNATLVNMACYKNEASGFYFNGKRASGECVNCDAYDNIGPTALSIGNIDGFGAHGGEVAFRYCRAWNNSDDGFDCISSFGPVTFDHCWAFDMRAGGDSNGFKVGGYGRADASRVPEIVPVHTVQYCIAAENNSNGFYANHQPGQAAQWTYNTAFHNRRGNFNLLECASREDNTDIPGTREILHYNISYDGQIVNDNHPAEQVTDNSWTKDGLALSDEDFLSLDWTQLSLPRRQDGSLPEITFMRPADNVKLKGMGCFAEEFFLSWKVAKGEKEYGFEIKALNGDKGTFIAALYREGELVSMQSKPYFGEADIHINVPCEVSAEEARLFLWDGLAAITPLREMERIKLEEE